MFPTLLHSTYLTLYSYPLFLGLALGVSYYVSFYLTHRLSLSEKSFHLIWWPSVLSAWVGAKVLFLISATGVTLPHDILVNSSFWLGGGFVFYGGLLFLLIYMFIGLKLKLFILEDLSRFVPAIALGHAVGRVGCFLAGCCYGKPSDHWDHVFMHDAYRYPVQIYEAVALFILGVILFSMVLKRSKSSSVFLIYIFSYSIIRFSLEFFRGDKIRGIWGFFSTSQIISIILIVLAVIAWALRGKCYDSK